MTDKPNSFEAKTKVLPKLLVDKAYEMLTSGEKLTASELKVCLDKMRPRVVQFIVCVDKIRSRGAQ